MNDPLRKPSQAGDYCGLTPAALAQMRYLGTGPVFIKLTARAVRYRQSDLDDWINGNARTSTGGDRPNASVA